MKEKVQGAQKESATSGKKEKSVKSEDSRSDALFCAAHKNLH
jgi:hypothetical protein